MGPRWRLLVRVGRLPECRSLRSESDLPGPGCACPVDACVLDVEEHHRWVHPPDFVLAPTPGLQVWSTARPWGQCPGCGTTRPSLCRFDTDWAHGLAAIGETRPEGCLSDDGRVAREDRVAAAFGVDPRVAGVGSPPYRRYPGRVTGRDLLWAGFVVAAIVVVVVDSWWGLVWP